MRIEHKGKGDVGILAQIFIGSPGMLSSLFISLFGIYYKRPYYLVIGSLLSIGFAWYLTALPLLLYNVLGYFLPLSHLLAIVFLRINKNWGYFLVVLPYGIFFISSLLIPFIYGT